jgi:lactose/cellobiose-specific phosphotransferase system IIC component
VIKFFKTHSEIWLLSIRDGFVSLLPLTLFGVVAVLLQQFPYQPYLSFLSGVFGPHWQDYLGRAVSASHGVFGLALSMVVAVHITARLPSPEPEEDGVSPMMVAVSTLVNFMICVLYSPRRDASLGYEAMLLGIVVGIASAELLRWSASRRWLTLVHVQFDADKSVHQALRLTTPILFSGVLTLVVAGFLWQLPVSYHPFELLAEWAREQPYREFIATSVVTFVNQLFWFVGVHGGHVLDTYTSDLFSPADMVPGGLAWRPMIDAFVLIGGAGSTLGLVFAIWYAVPEGSQRRIAMLGLFPSIFNINEVILFGLPVVLSPIYVLPFILIPLILATMTLLAMQTGLIVLQPEGIPWTTPPLISGWLLSDSWRGAALQLLEIFVATVFYLPFVHMAEAERKRRLSRLYQNAVDLIQAEVPRRAMVIRRRDEIGMVARTLLADLRGDIRRKQLSLNYQPKHDQEGRLVGLEALIHWFSPRHGRIPAPVAVNLAEDGCCIGDLGDWAINEACACKARWNALGYGELSVAVNVSPTQLSDPGFARRFQAMLDLYGLRRDEIEIEITESEAIPDEAATNSNLQTLSDMGVRLSMDDFGMGYSSLLHLRRFNIHAIKIDGSLTRDVLMNTTNADIIRAITSLGKARNVEVVAEYVETLEQREALAGMGCDVFQGHYHSPPLSESDCLSYFARHVGEVSGKTGVD